MFITVIGALMIIYGLIIVPVRARLSSGKARRAAEAGATPADQVTWRARESPGSVVSVAGTAGPGPDGPLESPISRRPCVWYRVVEIERRVHRRLGDDEHRRSEIREHVVRDEASAQPFTVTDEHGEVTVRPRSMEIRDLAPVVDRRDDATPDPENMKRVGVGRFGVDLNTSDVRGVITREWLIEDGQPVTVRGAAVDGERGGEIGLLPQGGFVISPGSLDDVAESEHRGAKKAILTGLLIAGVGAVLLLTGLAS